MDMQDTAKLKGSTHFFFIYRSSSSSGSGASAAYKLSGEGRNLWRGDTIRTCSSSLWYVAIIAASTDTSGGARAGAATKSRVEFLCIERFS